MIQYVMTYADISGIVDGLCGILTQTRFTHFISEAIIKTNEIKMNNGRNN